MAKFHPPTNFSFDKPAEWPDWKQRFVRFRTAAKLKEDGAVQVSSLIYAMGSESENVFRLFTFAEEGDEEDDFDVVLAKFDEYFVPRRNVIHERACFHQRLQRPGEKAETFIRALYELSEHCDFGASREENIRDRIVVGILDKDVSRKLQLMKDLTLAVTVQTVRQSEEVASQISMQGEATGAVHEVSHKFKKFNKNVKYGGAVSKAADGSSKQWAVNLLVGSTPVEFKINTGADVNIIREETYHSLRPKTPLEPADIPLDSPGGELQCIGQFQSTVAYKGKTHPLTAYVIRGHTVSNLLSRPLSVKMNLRLLMRLMRFNPVAEYAPGKTLVVADTLSRSPLSSTCAETDTQSDVACYVAGVVGGIPASQSKMDVIKMATASDANLQSVIKFIHAGWPEHISKVPVSIREYVQVKAELSEHNGLVLRGCRIVVPQPMRKEILQKIHQGHQGLAKCRERACSSVWWPGLSTEISSLVTSCQNLQPKWPSRAAVKERDEQEKVRQAYYYNRRHGARLLPVLQPGDAVRSKLDHEKSWSPPAVISSESITPRSYIIKTQQGAELRRNRRHLQPEPQSECGYTCKPYAWSDCDQIWTGVAAPPSQSPISLTQARVTRPPPPSPLPRRPEDPEAWGCCSGWRRCLWGSWLQGLAGWAPEEARQLGRRGSSRRAWNSLSSPPPPPGRRGMIPLPSPPGAWGLGLLGPLAEGRLAWAAPGWIRGRLAADGCRWQSLRAASPLLRLARRCRSGGAGAGVAVLAAAGGSSVAWTALPCPVLVGGAPHWAPVWRGTSGHTPPKWLSFGALRHRTRGQPSLN
ncbi:hypothetical protein N1851_000550 [Merluccius polli]|uniref:Gypsy retrotransposon integrase-like protein 1 n=1 Tax=Merluccius polli TaxID=89951 RepID=A0AA47NC95_MERPO|nr:hypothetical protein N1851_000550 [Merluccius polli]